MRRRFFFEVMIQRIKYFSSLNLIGLANDVVKKYRVAVRDTNTDLSFDRLFKWKSFTTAFDEAKTSKKPIFLMIHKDWCTACIKLKEKFSKCMRLMDLSDRFVMVNVDTDDRPILNEKKFQPDGKYVPRILFYTADGDFIEEAYNKHKNADNEHKYFYSNPNQIVETMLYVLRKYSKEALPVILDQEQSLSSEAWDVDNDVIVPTLLH